MTKETIEKFRKIFKDKDDKENLARLEKSYELVYGKSKSPEPEVKKKA